MIHTGKCPNCQKQVGRIELQSVEISGAFSTPKYDGVSYLCPFCKTILGVGIDPIALKAETIDGVVKQLREA